LKIGVFAPTGQFDLKFQVYRKEHVKKTKIVAKVYELYVS